MGSFRLAAESICLSQSALSRRIEKLETALGNRLFDRTTRRVTLTLYGQFAERSEQLLAHVETVLADISQVSKARTAGDGGDSAFRRLLLYAGNNPQLSGALSPGAHPVD